MSKLATLASAKILAGINRLLAQLEKDIEALKRVNASKGMLKSGATIKQVTQLCTSTMDSTGDLIAKEYNWVVKESLWSSATLINCLEIDSRDHLGRVLESSENHLRHITTLIGSSELFDRTVSQLKSANDQVLTDVILSLTSHSLTKKNHLLKNAFGWIPKIFNSFK